MDIPGNSSTTATIAVGGSFNGTLEVAGDRDWIRVELVAGQSYQFTLNGTGGNPLFDPFLEIRSSDGSLLSQDDDAGPGLNPSMKFTAPVTGVYYLVARSYEDENQSPTAGDYTLSAAIAPPQNPLDAIDWGTKLSSNVVDVFFVPSGQSAGGQQSSGWSSGEISTVMNILSTISNVANLVFNHVHSAAGAEFRLVRSADPSLDYSGSMGPPGTGNAGVGIFNSNSSDWRGGFASGASGAALVMHEVLHGLGLAHPHDNGGNSEVWQGVTDDYDRFGEFNLNQGVYTNMSYNWGFPSRAAVSSGYGNQFGPMALDIALLQQKYGANTSYNSGDNIYTLTGGAQPGSFFASIWDTGGVDLIQYAGSSNVSIDLRAATLGFDEGAGGFVSRVFAAASGLTIAAGVVIENATGGSGNDTLTGNEFANYLTGGPGNDTLNASDGNDTLSGGAGVDSLDGGEGDDLMFGGADTDQIHGRAGNDTIAGGDGNDNLIGYEGDDAVYGGNGGDSLSGYQGDDLMTGNSGNDWLWGGPGADSLYGDGDDRIYGDEDNDLISGTRGNDRVYGGSGNDTVAGGDDDDIIYGQDGDDLVAGTLGQDTVLGEAGNDTVLGGDGDDQLFGGADDDDLYGGVGMDTLDGGDGNDLLAGADGVDSLMGGLGDDTLFGGAGADIVEGGDGVNELYGNDGNDLLRGGENSDLLNGGADNDHLLGAGGGDTLLGDVGDDTLIGGGGGDTMNGGDGNDRFEFYVGDGSDVINGFTAGAASEDVIFISGFGAAFDEFADILANASDDGTSTSITLGGGSITLTNVLVADLHQDDFLFG